MNQILPTFRRNLTHICNLKPYKETKWLMPNGNPTGLYVYNCVAEQNVPVILNDPHIATWYSCGPTVYDSAHIGHASCYVKLDIIQRILKNFFNIKLVTAMGITDIDDKIIKKALETKQTFTMVAQHYEKEFWHDMTSLNIEKPLIVSRVSDHIKGIQNFVQKLVESKAAYVTSDGSVYFNTSKYNYYGKLQKMQDSGGEPLDKNKINKMDFALWKGHKPGEPYWETSWGKGRPGWHIECSAMVSRVFGSQLDFHAGGIDLQFPHHENEEAQSCAYHNIRQWANYWIHVGHLHVKGDIKMSKSLKNTISIPDMLEKYSPDIFRMACLISNYKNVMEYSKALMETAESTLKKIKFFLKSADSYVNDNPNKTPAYIEKTLDELHKIEERNLESLKLDFNTSQCINNILTLINTTNKIIKADSAVYNPVHVVLISEYIIEFLDKLGVKLQENIEQNISNHLIDTVVEFRHTVRLNAITKKDQELLKACDIVRERLKQIKIQINDSTKSSWVYAK